MVRSLAVLFCGNRYRSALTRPYGLAANEKLRNEPILDLMIPLVTKPSQGFGDGFVGNP